MKHCEWCPFSACEGCAYQGGEASTGTPMECAKSPETWEDWSGKDERPPAPTGDPSEPPLTAYEAPKEGLPTW